MKHVAVDRSRVRASALIAVLGLVSAGLAGVAMASSFTLRPADNGRVIEPNGQTEAARIVVNRTGGVVYELSGDGQRQPKCTRANGCFRFWSPVTVSSRQRLSKAPSIKGTLAVWRRNGFLQVTLQGHPLYTFAGDHHRDLAAGDQLRSFGGTWHAVEISPSKKATPTPGTSGATTPATTTTTTTTPPSSSNTTPGSTTMTSTTTTSTTTTSATTPCLYPPCY